MRTVVIATDIVAGALALLLGSVAVRLTDPVPGALNTWLTCVPEGPERVCTGLPSPHWTLKEKTVLAERPDSVAPRVKVSGWPGTPPEGPETLAIGWIVTTLMPDSVPVTLETVSMAVIDWVAPVFSVAE